jgi:hypothetical protein
MSAEEGKVVIEENEEELVDYEENEEEAVVDAGADKDAGAKQKEVKKYKQNTTRLQIPSLSSLHDRCI